MVPVPAAPPSVFDEHCSARHALEVVSGKWSILVLSALAEEPRRPGALRRRIGGISRKVLTQTLRELECNGLIVREDRGTVPPHVEYHLSDLGRSLARTLRGLDRWAERNFPAIDAARALFAARRSDPDSPR